MCTSSSLFCACVCMHQHISYIHVCIYDRGGRKCVWACACLCAVQHAESYGWCVHFSQPACGRLFEMHPCMLLQENKESVCTHSAVYVHYCKCVCVCEKCVSVLQFMCLYVCNESLQSHWSALLHCSMSCPSLGRRQPPPGHSSKVAAGQSSPSAYPAHARVYINTKSVWCKSSETPVRARLTILRLCGLNKSSDM